MKLAILGVIAIAAGFATGADGLIYAGALWVVGGAIMRLVVGSPNDLEELDAKTAGFGDAFGGKRGVGSAMAIGVGGASAAIGLIPVGFDSDDLWRWAPVAIGVILAGMPLLALVMFSTGSGMEALAGAIGDPQHPAEITLNDIRETGVRINDRPRLELDITVRPDGAAAYDTTVKQVIGHAELGSLRPGTTYEGLVDLERPDVVRVTWFAPIDEAAGDEPDDIEGRLKRLDTLRSNGVITDAEYGHARSTILGDL